MRKDIGRRQSNGEVRLEDTDLENQVKPTSEFEREGRRAEPARAEHRESSKRSRARPSSDRTGPPGEGSAAADNADLERVATRAAGHDKLTWTPELVSRFWDLIGDSFLGRLAFSAGNSERLSQVFLPYLQPGMRYLDFGAGNGHFAERMVQAGYQMALYDPASLRDLHSRELLQGKSGFLGNMSPGSGTKFDGLFLIEVIEHVLDSDLESTFNLIREFLSPDGLLFLTTPNKEQLEDNFVVDPTNGLFFHRWQHVRSLSRQSLTKLLKRFEFEPIVIHEIEFSDLIFSETGAGLGVRAEFKELFATLRPLQIGNSSNLICVAARADAPAFGTASMLPRASLDAPPLQLLPRVALDPPSQKDLGPSVRDYIDRDATVEIVLAPEAITHRAGFSWVFNLSFLLPGDSSDRPCSARTWVYEDGRSLGPAHSAHTLISEAGGGPFSHWADTLVFSSSDNSDPTANGRRYTVRVNRVQFRGA
jgi:2-polyprenyl-3-methyl-5-hydroxy-6-metoxy-1,4-benzoquinol methylase